MNNTVITTIRCAALIAGVSFLWGCEPMQVVVSDDVGRQEVEESAAASANVPAADVPASGGGALGLPAGTQWIHGKNIEHWPEIFTLHGVKLHPAANNVHHHVTLNYSGLQDIPAWNVPGDPNNVHNVNGNVWVIRQFDGQWYIGTFEYLRVGQTTKEMGASASWKLVPRSGDRLGFMVSTLARHPKEYGTVAGGRTYQGRSAIFWTTWP